MWGWAPSLLRPRPAGLPHPLLQSCHPQPAQPHGTTCPTRGRPADGKERTDEEEPHRTHLSSRKDRQGSPERGAKGAGKGPEWQSDL